jgi:hypothetical protein
MYFSIERTALASILMASAVYHGWNSTKSSFAAVCHLKEANIVRSWNWHGDALKVNVDTQRVLEHTVSPRPFAWLMLRSLSCCLEDMLTKILEIRHCTIYNVLEDFPSLQARTSIDLQLARSTLSLESCRHGLYALYVPSHAV